MRDPATTINPEVEAAIEHTMKLLRPFARNGTLRRRDPP
jgi:hypothetical protein